MSFISYAQNFEDVMLWRALKHVENGFYIDVGAQDPIVDSVSLAFYNKGWRGVHVEPSSQYSEMLKSARPDETIEKMVVGLNGEEVDFYEVPNTGLSSADREIISQHIKSGYEAVKTKVPVVSMDSLLDKYNDKEIHWLKIDVEGMEKKVIESWVSSRKRPWVLVIESTEPTSANPSYKDWEHLVLEKGYVFSYYDGLNRFYVWPDHKEIVDKLRLPPNVFDDFIFSGTQQFCSHIVRLQHEAENKVFLLNKEVEDVYLELKKSNDELNKLKNELDKINDEFGNIYASNSWRITAPLRWFLQQSRLLRDYGLKARLKVVGKKIAYTCIAVPRNYLESNEAVKHKIIVIADRLGMYPALRSIYRRLIKYKGSNDVSNCSGGLLQPNSLDELPPRAKQLYYELKSSSGQQQESH